MDMLTVAHVLPDLAENGAGRVDEESDDQSYSDLKKEAVTRSL